MEKVFKIVFLDKEGKEFFTQEHLSSDEESANRYAQMMTRGLKEVETFELSLINDAKCRKDDAEFIKNPSVFNK